MQLSGYAFQDEIIDFLPNATLVIDHEGKVIAWNRAMEELTGVSAADMLGKGNYRRTGGYLRRETWGFLQQRLA